ncbi:hypothetical protein [Paenibacillus harenae]|uniref:hypothetical protein n=1 Tax=Paenibacillus harenae TaxID=306543 RepID=UPI00279279C7|nr:hypothetical protein [Paenibacillus harenae]MDQ0060206.1 FtsP/CotA-like multicopper oxidase with cupredoxin domain [Paenibacillus harenae]
MNRRRICSYDKDIAVTMQELDGAGYMINCRTDGVKLNAGPGETVRLRIVNSSNRTQYMGVAGVSFKVISMDGKDLNGPTKHYGQSICLLQLHCCWLGTS